MAQFLEEETVEGGIRVLRLNRPPVNALNPVFLDAIDRQLAELEGDASIRALVVTSSLKVFSAGMDLKEAIAFSPADQAAIVDGLNRAYGRLYAFPRPVIMAANGAAIAGGFFFVIAGDYRLAVPRALMGLTEVRVGVRFPVAPLEIARAELAPAACRRLLLGGRNVTAEEALSMGVVDELVAAGELHERALAIARDYAAIPPLAFAGIKAQLRAGVLDRIRRAVEDREDETLEGWFSAETRGAAAALLKAARGG